MNDMNGMNSLDVGRGRDAAFAAAKRSSARMLEMSVAIASALARAASLPTAKGPAMRSRAASFGILAADTCAIHGIRVAVSGPIPSEPAVLVANHLSYLDPLAIASVVPCTAIAKSELDRWPLIGGQARDLGIVFVRRKDAMSGARALKIALDRLRHGVSVLNFPEGTTSYGDALLPLRQGIFGLARIAGVAVVPIRIELETRSLAWVGDDAFLPHYLKLTTRRSTVVRLRFGEGLDARQFDSTESLVEAARAHLDPELAKMGPRARVLS
jgi:lyso-ornithine lipid O-acyltransferase